MLGPLTDPKVLVVEVVSSYRRMLVSFAVRVVFERPCVLPLGMGVVLKSRKRRVIHNEGVVTF